MMKVQNSEKFESKYNDFHSSSWKYHLQTFLHLVQVSMCSQIGGLNKMAHFVNMDP